MQFCQFYSSKVMRACRCSGPCALFKGAQYYFTKFLDIFHFSIMSLPDILPSVDSVQDDMYFSGLKFLQLDKEVWKRTRKNDHGQTSALRSLLHSEFAITKTEVDLLTSVNGPVDQELSPKMLAPQCPNNVQTIKINAILGIPVYVIY